MAFQVQLILFEPGYIQFLTGSTAFELSSYILFVISHDSVVDGSVTLSIKLC